MIHFSLENIIFHGKSLVPPPIVSLAPISTASYSLHLHQMNFESSMRCARQFPVFTFNFFSRMNALFCSPITPITLTCSCQRQSRVKPSLMSWSRHSFIYLHEEMRRKFILKTCNLPFFSVHYDKICRLYFEFFFLFRILLFSLLNALNWRLRVDTWKMKENEFNVGWRRVFISRVFIND